MPKVPHTTIPALDEKMAISQVNHTLKEILSELEQLNQTFKMLLSQVVASRS